MLNTLWATVHFRHRFRECHLDADELLNNACRMGNVAMLRMALEEPALRMQPFLSAKQFRHNFVLAISAGHVDIVRYLVLLRERSCEGQQQEWVTQAHYSLQTALHYGCSAVATYLRELIWTETAKLVRLRKSDAHDSAVPDIVLRPLYTCAHKRKYELLEGRILEQNDTGEFHDVTMDF
jgi:hypothetical protein